MSEVSSRVRYQYAHSSDDDESDDERYENESAFDNESDVDVVPDFIELVQGDEALELRDDAEEEEQQENLVATIEPNRGQKYVSQGKGDRTVWWSMPAQDEKDRTQRMKQNRAQSFPYCKETFDDYQKAFKRVFPPSIIGQIVIETNRKAKKVYEQFRRENPLRQMRPWKETDVDELFAYIAILLHCGAEKSHNVEAADLFHPTNMPFYRAVMSLKRFQQLTRFLRFDDSRTRLVRLREDKLAPIRYIWDLFSKNVTMPFVSSLEIVIDEQLLTTRNRCSFRQYIPSKPGKYGIKIFWAVESRTNYPLAAEVYVGTQPNQNRSTGVAHDLVLRLMKDHLYLGANLTVDNFFVSYKLAEDLLRKETTMVGTIRSNKRELPKFFTSADEAKKRGPNKSIFCFSDSCELVSYTSNTNKNVLLLSTAHATENVNESTGKPLIIHDYNEHKGGVDTFDKMLRAYTCKRRCSRWPMLMFFNMIDVAGLAAFRLIELSNPTWKGRDKRKKFLKALAFELAQNQLEKRSKTPNLRRSTKIAMNLIGFQPKYSPVKPRQMPKVQVDNRTFSHSVSLSFSLPIFFFLSWLCIFHSQVKNPNRRCEECKKDRRTKDNKTTAVCDLCLKPTCSLHYVRSCESCYLTKFMDPDTHEESGEEEEVDEEMPDAGPRPSTSARRPRVDSIINL